MKPLVNATLIALLLFYMLGTGFAQEQLGTQIQANGSNCTTGQSEARIAARAGYIGTVGANVFPRAGDITNVFITFQVLGTPCGLEGVYVEVALPAGATPAVANNRPVRCLLNGTEVTTSSEFSCGIFNEPNVFGGIVLGTNLLFAGQTMAINVPVRFASEVSNGPVQFGVRSSSANNDLFPEKRITVPSSAVTASIAYPNPSATNISSSSAQLNTTVTNNFNAGNVFFDLGTTTAYGTTSGATAIGSTNSAFDVTIPFSNLTPNTLFHWRARFVAQGGQTFTGADQTFRTAAGTVNTFRLTVTKAGTGSGFLSDTSGIIVCGNTCSSSFTSSSAVTLNAQPATGSIFAGWSGGGCSGTGTCQIIMTSDKTVTATFNTAPANTGSLAVTITGLPAGVNANVRVASPNGTNETITETRTLVLEQNGYVITASPVSTNGVTFTPSVPSQNVSVTSGNTSSFTVNYSSAPIPANTGSLQVTITGLSVPALVQIVKENNLSSVRTLTETTRLDNLEPGTYRVRAFIVKDGSTSFFASGIPQQVIVNPNAVAVSSVNVAYTAATGPILEPSRSLKVIVSEAAGSDGNVSASPVIKECASDECFLNFSDGLIVTLTANKDSNSIFTGWGGDCEASGTANTCTLLMENLVGFSNAVTASFASGNDLEVTSGAKNPEQLSLIGNTNNTLFQVNAKASRDVQVKRVNVSVTGTGNDVVDITAVKLVVDTNGNGQKDGGETEIATATFTEDNGTLTLAPVVPFVIAAGETSTLLVTWDVDPSVLEAIASLLPLTLLGLGLGKKKMLLALFVASSLLLSSCLQNPNPTPQVRTYTFSLSSINAELTTGGDAVVAGVPLTTKTLEVPR